MAQFHSSAFLFYSKMRLIFLLSYKNLSEDTFNDVHIAPSSRQQGESANGPLFARFTTTWWMGKRIKLYAMSAYMKLTFKR